MASGSSQDIYERTLAVFDRDGGRYEPLTTPEVTEALDVDRRAVYERLQRLVDRGDLETKEVGSHARVWWRPPGSSGADDADQAGLAGQSGDGPVREQALRQRSRAMESAIDGIAVVDESGEFVYVNETHADVYGYGDPAEMVGEHWHRCYDEAELARLEEEILPTLYDEGSWRGETRGRRADGTTFPQELSLTVSDDGGVICVVRDITERNAQERRLRDARRFNEELVENAPFGMFRLDEDLRITYENPRAEEIIGLPEEQDTSDAMGVDIRKLPPIVETGQSALFSQLQEGETIEFDFPFESIYGKEAYFTGRAVPVYRDGEFDGAILMATDISERRQYERRLERQREQLAALDELNGVVRGITEAVIEQSTREEIEQVVCDRLAAADSYRFAWISAADAGLELETRAAAGVDDDFTDRSVATTPNEATGQGPIRRAVRTREMQITRNALDSDTPQRLREAARESGYQSLAVIPVVHQGMFYGVLGVSSGRPDAFAVEERAVIGQLGDVIGHAIAAVDRKRALMGNEVVELTIRIPGLLGDQVPNSTEGTITIDRVTPVGDDEYLAYGTATEDGMEMIRALGEHRSEWTELRTFDERDDEVRFEQRLSNPPLTSIVADYGGNFKCGWIEDGVYSATIQFPPGTDVRGVVTHIQESYLDVRVVSRRQVVREDPTSQHILDVLAEDLTERQRTALEAGYFGGFFEWPRHRSGEAVAESLDIGASTFHQHVRKAEKKLLDVVFAEL
ncbi:bacterio-opsin activator domain-containing protein [Haloplanus ruber]|uniref:Bacterio-opsin activator domain-containing protein n=1 Tax=Haloplanus ruber TaxID=869892 RepID=A0ABD6D045_9EURY|nr:bacterio-opsin activator domain-containing protein [Haloplanus ruber]